MKRTSTQGINEQNNKGEVSIMRLSLLLTLLFILLLSFTSYASDDTALISAAIKGDVSRVNELLDKGANVNAKAFDGWTALMWASSNGNVEIVKALIDKGADVDVRNNAGYTALMLAFLFGRTEIVQLLRRTGTR